jgi:NitT/TauT family transport system substrate-binding protein
VAACSSSASSTTSSGATASSGSGTVSLTFGDLSPNTNLTPVYAAEDQGLFKAAGLDVTIQKFTGGGASSVAALATGAVQIASGGPTNFVGDMAKKVISGKVFAELLDSNYDIVVPKNITSVAQLKGKVLGVSGANSADAIFLAATLEHYGITPSQVTTITAGTTSERLTALSTGKIQAIADADTERPAEKNVGKVLIPSEDNPIKVPGVTFFASDSYLASSSPTLKRFMAVVDKAVVWVKKPANETTAVSDCEQGSGATAAACQQTIAASKDTSMAGRWTWSATSALNPAGIKEAIAATSILVPQAKSLSLSDVADTSITGTSP